MEEYSIVEIYIWLRSEQIDLFQIEVLKAKMILVKEEFFFSKEIEMLI